MPARTPKPIASKGITPGTTAPLQCFDCMTVYPYTTTIDAPGGPIGILFHFENLGCPNCGSSRYGLEGLAPAKPAAKKK